MKLISTASLILCSALVADLNFFLFSQARMDTTAAVRRLLPPPTVDTSGLIHVAAKKHKVPEAFVKSIVAAESNFKPDAVSCKGAIGLMQLMPETAQDFGADPKIPEENIDAGTQYLGWLIARYHKYHNGMTRAIAAYNAGPGVVDRFRGVPPYRETRGYVARVMAFMRRYQRG
jgi:soluble lytic murein transglycosylase-like protein